MKIVIKKGKDLMIKTLARDIDYICRVCDKELARLDGKTILVTGATGLIGFNLVSALSACKYRMNVLAFVRNQSKAEDMYKEIADRIKFIVGDITEKIEIEEPVDYIIHAASQTASKAFINEPVETILTAVNGTRSMLELAKKKSVSGFMYLSTMEIYGMPETSEKIMENHATNLDTMAVRSSYPESKRMCETLCKAYQSEYHIPTKIVRLTQTFGPGVKYGDGRVFAEFARCVIENRNIVLHTKGKTERNYLYTADAVTGILTVLLNGTEGEAYNMANENTYCSIYDMAKMVIEKCGNKEIEVVVEEHDCNDLGYAPTLKMNLDTQKIRNLGWKPTVGLSQMYEKLICSMKESSERDE